MNDSKSVKALKKQMGAAIAMVCVAAIALGSSTYAWFVSNNNVKATTTNISAQSNSAYLVIDTQKTNTSSTSSATAAEKVGSNEGDTYKDAALYPAQWAMNIATMNIGDSCIARLESPGMEKVNPIDVGGNGMYFIR